MIAKLIIRVVVGNSVHFLLPNNELPSINIYPDQIYTSLLQEAMKYDIPTHYTSNIKLVDLSSYDDEFIAYYTLFCPLEFINEKYHNQIHANTSQLPLEDQLAIRLSLSILPY